MCPRTDGKFPLTTGHQDVAQASRRKHSRKETFTRAHFPLGVPAPHLVRVLMINQGLGEWIFARNNRLTQRVRSPGQCARLRTQRACRAAGALNDG